MTRILQFTTGPDDWKALLAHQKHWRTGYSARTLAHAWEDAEGFPSEVTAALATPGDPLLERLKPLLAIPEFKVPLPGGKRSSQNDLFVLARSTKGPVVVMVEGKCAESFGPTLGKWIEQKGGGRKKRLRFLEETLGISKPKAAIRYQLLHRAASAVLTAEQYRAAAAVLVIHSFDSPKEGKQPAGWADYLAFAAMLGVEAATGTVQRFAAKTSVPLFGLWLAGDLKYTNC